MKHYGLFLITLLCISSVILAEKETMKRTDKSLTQQKMFNDLLSGKAKVSDPSLKMPKTKTYWQGWVKYFHYDIGEKVDKPNSFFINNEFYNQVVQKSQRADKDKRGYINIPTKYHFYAKVMKDGLNIITSRKHGIMKTVDTMPIDLITPVPEDARLKGGITDLGNFDEGKCIQVQTKIPAYYNKYFYSGLDSGMIEHWIVCTDDLNPKKSLMNMLVRLRILKQTSVGVKETLSRPKRKRPSLASLKNQQKDKGVERYYGPGHNLKKDGYWILLNDWSQCTLHCGGGKSYQQWMCVPPKKGGKNCVGTAIREKNCNEKPCPGVSSISGLVSTPNNKVVPPIWKMLPFSNRPQRYIKCQIKEGDILYKDWSRPMVNENDPVKIPARLVMNNSTISLYTDEAYTSSLFTFRLPLVSIKPDVKDNCCFIIRSNNKKFDICSFQKDCGTKSNPIFFNEWSRELSFFSDACSDLQRTGNGLARLPKKGDIYDDIKNGVSSKSNSQQEMIAHAQMAMMEEREKLLKDKLQAAEKKQVEGKVGKTQKTVIKALRKEMKLENLIKKEETEKFEDETRNLILKFQHEKKKKKCLDKILKSREEEDAKVREEMEVQKEIQRLKEDAVKVVNKKRTSLKKRILAIKKKLQRKNRLIEQQIQKVRGSMASELMQANKQGSWKVCKANRNDKKKMLDYCNANFIDDYAKNMNCRDPENFCYVCCENEYGNMFLKKRDQCYTICDELSKTDLNNGDWVWNDNILKKK